MDKGSRVKIVDRYHPPFGGRRGRIVTEHPGGPPGSRVFFVDLDGDLPREARSLWMNESDLEEVDESEGADER